MKGLIIKDIFCMKKQLIIFTYVLAGVLIVSIMYVLSAKFGNLAEVAKELQNEKNNLTPRDVKNISTEALILFMFLPAATICDMVFVFASDAKAGFVKVAATLPVPLWKRLLAKYMTIIALFGIGLCVDIVVAGILCAIGSVLTFGEYFGIIISVTSVMFIYSSFVILWCVILGSGNEQFAQILSIASLIVLFVICYFGAIKNFITSILSDNVGVSSIFGTPIEYIKNRGWVFFIAAAVVCAFTYAVSLKVADRKRGVI
jgi:hypothetical protein